MKKEILDLMSEMDFCNPLPEDAMKELEAELNVVFPTEYKALMKITNGAEGPLGENAYLSIWPLDEIAELNENYGVQKFTPGLVYFGSDGGDTAYAFDFRADPPAIVAIPFDSIEIEDAEKIADTPEEMILFLYRQ